MDNRKLYEKVFGVCPMCRRWFRLDIKRRRQNTQYEDYESNYVTTCADCFEDIEAYWDEMWEWYYSTRL